VPIALKQHGENVRAITTLIGHANCGRAARLVGEAFGVIHLGRHRLDLGQRRGQLRVVGAVGVRVPNHLAQEQRVAAKRKRRKHGGNENYLE
jgi:hypothetical protein